MKTQTNIPALCIALLFFLLCSCNNGKLFTRSANRQMPSHFNTRFRDTANGSKINWRNYFSDENLQALIDTALLNNQELKIMMQEIQVSKNEIRARKGDYLPFLSGGTGMELEKAARYTRTGAVDEQLEIKPGERFPDPMRNFGLNVTAKWELDIWNKLRNAKKAALSRYLASAEAKNFMITNLISEISGSYYELMALDNLLAIIEKNIEIQSGALNIVKQQKESAKVTQLAVNRFESQLLNTRNLQYDVKQKIVETENRINFLTARFPQPIKRNSEDFLNLSLDSLSIGIPSQLLTNRPDIRKAEFELAAADLDVKVARANFYPSLGIRAGVGFQAYYPALLFGPESILFSFAGDLMAPLINRNAIKAAYSSANSRQLQTVFKFEQTVLNAFLDLQNQLSRSENFSKSFEIKSKEVELLAQSVNIATNLFNSARADYSEILFTQREALDSKMELVDIKLKQLNSKINIYRALGGGWKN